MRTPAQTIGLNLLVQQHLLSRPDSTLSMKAIKHVTCKDLQRTTFIFSVFFFLQPSQTKKYEVACLLLVNVGNGNAMVCFNR